MMPADESAHSSRVKWPIEIASRMPWPSADEPGIGAAKFDLGGGVRPVAGLVLEPLDHDPVAAAVRQPPRHKEAGDAALGARQRDEDVRVRHREEPLMPGDAPAVAVPLGGALRLAQVRAALLLGH